MTRGPRYTAALAAIASTLVLGACGSDDKGPDQPGDGPDTTSGAGDAAGEAWADRTSASMMFRTGLRELDRATSVHAVAVLAPDDEPRTTIDLTVIDDDNCFGTLTFGTDPQVDLTVVDGKDFLRTTVAGWRTFVQSTDPSISDEQGTTVGRLYAGKWVSTGGAAPFCRTLDQLDIDGAEPGRKVGLTEIDGHRGVKVRLTSGDDDAIAVFALAEPHRVLTFSVPGASVTFDRYDESTEAPLPPARDQIDVTP